MIRHEWKVVSLMKKPIQFEQPMVNPVTTFLSYICLWGINQLIAAVSLYFSGLLPTIHWQMFAIRCIFSST